MGATVRGGGEIWGNVERERERERERARGAMSWAALLYIMYNDKHHQKGLKIFKKKKPNSRETSNSRSLKTMKIRDIYTDKPWFLGLLLLGLIGGVLVISSFFRATDKSFLCAVVSSNPERRPGSAAGQIQLKAILHYATSRVVPQQSVAEIRISFDVLRSLSPCNFLVFGLGHDSLMWASFNALGTTLFLEEDPKWVQNVLKDAPDLRAHTVRYRTQLSEADELLSSYRSVPECSPSKAYLRGNVRCRLALADLPAEVYEREWDLIMIDAPRGYFAEAPGRMAAIYSAAVMARSRKGSGVTHVFLHDVDRKVEKAFATEFLCKKHLVKGTGRLWHFQIPSASNVSPSAEFC